MFGSISDLIKQLRASPEEAMRIANESGDVYPSIVPEPGSPEAESQIRVPVLEVETPTLKDSVRGVLVGNAVGDAIGLLTEFMTKKFAAAVYSKSAKLSFADCAQDRHRAKFERGDWTDDTDQAILLLDTLLAHGGSFDRTDFAARILYWMDHGFPELGDLGGLGVGRTVCSVLENKDPDFRTDPHGAARSVWLRSKCNLAANGALMRSSVLGIPHFHSLDDTAALARDGCLITHTDPRCVASCVTLCVCVALLIRGTDVPEALRQALDWGFKELRRESDDDEGLEFDVDAAERDWKLYVGNDMLSLEILHLDDQPSIGYTLKCLGAGVWALRAVDGGMSSEEALTQLVFEAGDADTNCAVAGALIGAHLGENRLKSEVGWVHEMPHLQWLLDRLDRLTRLMGL